MLRLQPHITALDGDWTRLRYSLKRREAIGDTEVSMDAGWSLQIHSIRLVPLYQMPCVALCIAFCWLFFVVIEFFSLF